MPERSENETELYSFLQTPCQQCITTHPDAQIVTWSEQSHVASGHHDASTKHCRHHLKQHRFPLDEIPQSFLIKVKE